MKRNRIHSNNEGSKETPTQKFFRQREEKLAKKRRREERRKVKLQKPKDMSGAFPHTPGIYKLINKRTGKVYVSYSKKMSRGINTHLFNLRHNSHDNPDLQEDYNKGDRFYVVILREYMEYDKETLMEDTKDFIKSENSFIKGYNRSKGVTFNPKYHH